MKEQSVVLPSSWTTLAVGWNNCQGLGKYCVKKKPLFFFMEMVGYILPTRFLILTQTPACGRTFFFCIYMRKTWVYKFLKFDPVPDRPTYQAYRTPSHFTTHVTQEAVTLSIASAWLICLHGSCTLETFRDSRRSSKTNPSLRSTSDESDVVAFRISVLIECMSASVIFGIAHSSQNIF